MLGFFCGEIFILLLLLFCSLFVVSYINFDGSSMGFQFIKSYIYKLIFFILLLFVLINVVLDKDNDILEELTKLNYNPDEPISSLIFGPLGIFK